MVSTYFNRRDAAAPVMLWVRDGNCKHSYSLFVWRRFGEILVVDSVEEGLELLVHQPVDVLLVDMPVLRTADSDLLGEIHRCWPYLLCLVLSESQEADAGLESDDALTVLHLPEDSLLLSQQLLKGFGHLGAKHRVH